MYLLDASLSLVDTPTGYSSPVGPAVPFTVRYRQRDNQFSSTFNYSNFGPKWTFDWLVSDPAQTVPSGMATTNNYLYYRNTYYWDKQGCAYGDYTKARIYHWLHSADLLSPMGILESTKAPLEGRVWYDYTGQTTSNGSIVVGTTSKPTHTGRVLDDGSTQLYSREYNNFGNITAAIDPAGRTLSYIYATNGIDLLETRQTRAGQSELIRQTTYDAQHQPLTSTDAAGQTTTFTCNNQGQLATATDALGNTTTYQYDADGYCTSATGPLWINYGILNGLVCDVNSCSPQLSAPTPLMAGTWYHLAYTVDNTAQQQALYVNGARVASGTTTVPAGYDTQPLLLGRDTENGSPNFFLQGRIDEATIYNRALTPAEIASIYNAGPAGKVTA